MGIKNTIKQIRCRLSREYCYREMSRAGHALMLFCEGKGVDIGDSGMESVPLRCTRCPRYFEGFSVERYNRDILGHRVSGRGTQMKTKEELKKTLEFINSHKPPESYILICSPEMASLIDQFGTLPENVTIQKSPHCCLDKE